MAKRSRDVVLEQALQSAVRRSDEEGVRQAVRDGADVNALMADGFSRNKMAALHEAAFQGSESMIRLLVTELGAAEPPHDVGGLHWTTAATHVSVLPFRAMRRKNEHV